MRIQKPPAYLVEPEVLFLKERIAGNLLKKTPEAGGCLRLYFVQGGAPPTSSPVFLTVRINLKD